jgi:hypothetical protein
VYQAASTWKGNEVEKRSFMFRLAEQSAEPNVDWYFVLDGDEIVTDCCDLHAELAACKLDAGAVMLWQYLICERLSGTWRRNFIQQLTEHSLRKLFRAIPGLSVVGSHWHYRCPDGRYLWVRLLKARACQPSYPTESDLESHLRGHLTRLLTNRG